MMMTIILVELGTYPDFFFLIIIVSPEVIMLQFFSQNQISKLSDFLCPAILQMMPFPQHILKEEDAQLHLAYPFDLLKTSEAKEDFC